MRWKPYQDMRIQRLQQLRAKCADAGEFQVRRIQMEREADRRTAERIARRQRQTQEAAK